MTTTTEPLPIRAPLPPRALRTYVQVRQYLADARLAIVQTASEDHDRDPIHESR